VKALGFSAAGLLIACLVIFCTVFRVSSFDNLNTPFEFSGDALFFQAATLQCHELKFGCLMGEEVTRLGAFRSANWGDFPRSDDWLQLLCAQLLAVMPLGAAVNVLFFCAAFFSSLSFFMVARRQKITGSWAFVLSLLFAFCPFYFTRNEQHISLTFFASVPLSIFVCAQLWRGRLTKATAGLSLLMGLQMVYFTAYHGFGLALAGLRSALGRPSRESPKRKSAMKLVGLAMLCTLAGAVLGNADTFRLRNQRGSNFHAIARQASDATGFALWPEQLVIPSEFHRVAWVREAASTYARRFGHRGEYPSAYLGVMGALGVAGLLSRGFRRLKRAWHFEWAMAMGLIVLALPVVGLLALWARFTGLIFLRSNNRVSIFLLCLGLLFLGRALSILTARARIHSGIAMVALGLGLLEQLPLTDFEIDADHRQHTAEQVANVTAFTHSLEALGAKKVFLFPHLDFPESAENPFGEAYVPLQLYVTSSTLRLSYGAVKGRPESEWSKMVSALPDAELVSQLTGQQFDTLVSHVKACDAACQTRFTGLFGAPLTTPTKSGFLSWSIH
jgi:phosphoglycerol transferase